MTSKAYEICLELLRRDPELSFNEAKIACSKRKQKLYPIVYGRVRKMVGPVATNQGKPDPKGEKTTIKRATAGHTRPESRLKARAARESKNAGDVPPCGKFMGQITGPKGTRRRYSMEEREEILAWKNAEPYRSQDDAALHFGLSGGALLSNWRNSVKRASAARARDQKKVREAATENDNGYDPLLYFSMMQKDFRTMSSALSKIRRLILTDEEFDLLESRR